MFEETNHYDSELDFATVEDEGDSSSASTNEENFVEESNDDLNLEDKTEEVKDSAEVVRARTIAAWQARVDSGEVTLDQIPHAWIRREVTAKQPMVDEAQLEKIAERLVEQKLAQKEDQAKFERLNGELKTLSLTAAQQEELKQEYQDLRASGIPKAIALEKAMKIAGIASLEAQRMKELRLNAQVIPRGRGTRGEDPSSQDISRKSPEDRLKLYESTLKEK